MASLATLIRQRRAQGLDLIDSRTGQLRGAPRPTQRQSRAEALAEAREAIDRALGTESTKRTRSAVPGKPAAPPASVPDVNALTPGFDIGDPGERFNPKYSDAQMARRAGRQLIFGPGFDLRKATPEQLLRLNTFGDPRSPGYSPGEAGAVLPHQLKRRRRALSSTLRA